MRILIRSMLAHLLLLAIIATITTSADQVELEDQIIKAKSQNTQITEKLQQDIKTLEGYRDRLTEKEAEPDIQTDVSRWEIVRAKKALVEESIAKLQQRMENWINTEALGDNYKLTQYYDDEVAIIESDQVLMGLLGNEKVKREPIVKETKVEAEVEAKPAVVKDFVLFDNVALREKLIALPAATLKSDAAVDGEAKAVEPKKEDANVDFVAGNDNRVNKLNDIAKMNIPEVKDKTLDNNNEPQKEVKPSNKPSTDDISEPNPKPILVTSEQTNDEYKPTEVNRLDEREKLAATSNVIEKPKTDTSKPDPKQLAPPNRTNATTDSTITTNSTMGTTDNSVTKGANVVGDATTPFIPNKLSEREKVALLPPIMVNTESNDFVKTDKFDVFESIARETQPDTKTNVSSPVDAKPSGQSGEENRKPASLSIPEPAPPTPEQKEAKAIDNTINKLSEEQQKLKDKEENLKMSESEVIGIYNKLLNPNEVVNQPEKTKIDVVVAKSKYQIEIIDDSKPFKPVSKPLGGINIADDVVQPANTRLVTNTAQEQKRERKDFDVIKQRNKYIKEENTKIASIETKIEKIEEKVKIIEREKNAIKAVEDRVMEEREAKAEEAVLKDQREALALEKVMNHIIESEGIPTRRLMAIMDKKKHIPVFTDELRRVLNAIDIANRKVYSFGKHRGVISQLISSHKMILDTDDIMFLRILEDLEKQATDINIGVKPTGNGNTNQQIQSSIAGQDKDLSKVNQPTQQLQTPGTQQTSNEVQSSQVLGVMPIVQTDNGVSTLQTANPVTTVQRDNAVQSIQTTSHNNTDIDSPPQTPDLTSNNASSIQNNMTEQPNTSTFSNESVQSIAPIDQTQLPLSLPMIEPQPSTPVSVDNKNTDNNNQIKEINTDNESKSNSNSDSDELEEDRTAPEELLSDNDDENLAILNNLFRLNDPFQLGQDENSFHNPEINTQIERAKSMLNISKDSKIFNGSISVTETELQDKNDKPESAYTIVVSKRIEGSQPGKLNVVEIGKTNDGKEANVKTYQIDDTAETGLLGLTDIAKLIGDNTQPINNPLDANQVDQQIREVLPVVDNVDPETLQLIKQTVKKLALSVQLEDVKRFSTTLLDYLNGLYKQFDADSTAKIKTALSTIKTDMNSNNSDYIPNALRLISDAQLLLSDAVGQEFDRNGISSYHTALIITSYGLDDISAKLSNSSVIKPHKVSDYEDLLDKLIANIKAQINYMFVFDPSFYETTKLTINDNNTKNIKTQDTGTINKVNTITNEGVDNLYKEIQYISYIESVELRNTITRILARELTAVSTSSNNSNQIPELTDQQLDHIAHSVLEEIKQYSYGVYNKRLEDVFSLVNDLRAKLNGLANPDVDVELCLSTVFSVLSTKYSDILSAVGRMKLTDQVNTTDRQERSILIDESALKLSLKGIIDYYVRNAKHNSGDNHVEKVTRMLCKDQNKNLSKTTLLNGLVVEAKKRGLSYPLTYLLHHLIGMWMDRRYYKVSRQLNSLRHLIEGRNKHFMRHRRSVKRRVNSEIY